MIVTKDDFVEWKKDSVTEAFYEACVTRMEDAKDILVGQAGLDSDLDNFYRGFIHAYKEMLNFDIKDFD